MRAQYGDALPAAFTGEHGHGVPQQVPSSNDDAMYSAMPRCTVVAQLPGMWIQHLRCMPRSKSCLLAVMPGLHTVEDGIALYGIC